MTDLHVGLPPAFVDLTLSPVSKGDGRGPEKGNKRAAVLGTGKRPMPAAHADVSHRAAKKTTSHSTAKLYIDLLEEEEGQGNKENEQEASPQQSALTVAALSRQLDAILDVQYAHEIHLTHLDNERDYFERRVAAAASASQATDITPQMRAILVDWLIEVAEEYYLTSQTLHLSVSYVDRFLGTNKVARASLQLLGVACMLIASKFEEIYAPLVDDFAYITDNTYSRADILSTETIVLNALDFRLAASTVVNFLERFLTVANVHLDTRIVQLAKYLAELALPQAWTLKFRPSLVATCCVSLALHTVGLNAMPAALECYTQYTRAQLSPVMKELHNTYIAANTAPKSPAAKEKFRLPKYHSVAELRPPATPPY